MSWQQLLSIQEENARELRREATAAPVDCPKCGTRLESRGDVLHCPFGDWMSNWFVLPLTE